VGRSLFWGLQYHPEFDLAHQAALFRLYRDDLLSQGFLADDAALDAYLADWDALAADPTDRGLAWQLGIDEDTLDDGRRRGEIGNWLRDCVR
jgi:GMP synthase (glutamine-hydrolysing)